MKKRLFFALLLGALTFSQTTFGMNSKETIKKFTTFRELGLCDDVMVEILKFVGRKIKLLGIGLCCKDGQRLCMKLYWLPYFALLLNPTKNFFYKKHDGEKSYFDSFKLFWEKHSSGNKDKIKKQVVVDFSNHKEAELKNIYEIIEFIGCNIVGLNFNNCTFNRTNNTSLDQPHLKSLICKISEFEGMISLNFNTVKPILHLLIPSKEVPFIFGHSFFSIFEELSKLKKLKEFKCDVDRHNNEVNIDNAMVSKYTADKHKSSFATFLKNNQDLVCLAIPTFLISKNVISKNFCPKALKQLEIGHEVTKEILSFLVKNCKKLEVLKLLSLGFYEENGVYTTESAPALRNLISLKVLFVGSKNKNHFRDDHREISAMSTPNDSDLISILKNIPNNIKRLCFDLRSRWYYVEIFRLLKHKVAEFIINGVKNKTISLEVLKLQFTVKRHNFEHVSSFLREIKNANISFSLNYEKEKSMSTYDITIIIRPNLELKKTNGLNSNK